jgi:hypothetical protein
MAPPSGHNILSQSKAKKTLLQQTMKACVRVDAKFDTHF